MKTHGTGAGPYGCHNRAPFLETVRVQAGWIDSGPSRVPVMKDVPFVMSRGCQYQRDPMGLGGKDPRCTGCKWKEEGNAT